MLSFALTRFSYDFNEERNVKILSSFSFPENIDLSFLRPECLPDHTAPEDLHYTLHAVFVHVGNSAELGHYKALVKIDEKWYQFDDEEVSEIYWAQVTGKSYGDFLTKTSLDRKSGKIEEVVFEKASHAYLLMYVRQSAVRRLVRGDNK